MEDEIVPARAAGNLSLEDIQSTIAGAEALNMLFVDCTISRDGTETYNVLAFQRRYELPLPARPKLVLAGSPAPSGLRLQWRGEMQVANQQRTVVLYR